MIPIKSGPSELKIHGVDGMTTAVVLDRINQGARLVMYRYSMSFVSISFLRSSDIFCIGPGHSRVIPGLRYSLLSVVLGWWALSGIIFTIKALAQNFRGGLDVTDQVVAVFSKAPGDSHPRLILEDSTLSLAPPPQSIVFDPARAAVAAASRRRNINFFLLIGFIVTAVAMIAAVHCATHYPLALVNGIEQPYEVELDGRVISLAPHHAQVLAITVGKHIARATLPDGSERSCQFEAGADWYNPSTPALCTIVNPDRGALIAEQHRVYGESTPALNLPAPRVWASHEQLTIECPWFFFEDFAPSVEVPKGATDTLRNQIIMVPPQPVDECIRLLFKYGTQEDLRNYRDLLSANGSPGPLLKVK